jgi:hypothetical protein
MQFFTWQHDIVGVAHYTMDNLIFLVPGVMLLMMHQPFFHQPWRLYRCHPCKYFTRDMPCAVRTRKRSIARASSDDGPTSSSAGDSPSALEQAAPSSGAAQDAPTEEDILLAQLEASSLVHPQPTGICHAEVMDHAMLSKDQPDALLCLNRHYQSRCNRGAKLFPAGRVRSMDYPA